MRNCHYTLVYITLPAKNWVASNVPCFETSKMWSAVFVPQELTEILKNLSKIKSIKYNKGWLNLQYLRLFI